MTATEAGADWISDPRRPYPGQSKTPSNKEILEYLAEGNDKSENRVERDITLNDADGDELNKIVADELTERLRKVGKIVTPTKGANAGKGVMLTAEKQAKGGIANGLRKAAKRAAAIMYDRLKTGKDNKGAGLTPPTSSKYTAWRKRHFGVNENVVLVASRQLAEALQKGRIKIRFNTAKLGRALNILKRG